MTLSVEALQYAILEVHHSPAWNLAALARLTTANGFGCHSVTLRSDRIERVWRQEGAGLDWFNN